MHRSGLSTSWGGLFGINPQDLPINILNQLAFRKLVELVGIDQRAEALVNIKMPDQLINNISYVTNIPNIHSYPAIIDRYNDYIENMYKNNKRTTYPMLNAIKWNLLNEKNRITELKRWMADKGSVLHDLNVDYDWVGKVNPDFVDAIIEKNMKVLHHVKYSQGALMNMISTIGLDRMESVMERVFKKSTSNRLKLHALTNRQLPEKYTLIALKLLSSRTWGVPVNVPITRQILEKLPTITRLKAVERLLERNIVLDISEEDFRSILFGSLIRYPNRVEKAIKKFNYLNKRKAA